MLAPLLAYLDVNQPQASTTWCDWQIQPIGGGANNRVYRATRGGDDFAIKFTIADARDRAGREHAVLVTLFHLGLAIAPESLLLDQTTYAQHVVAQRWLAGDVEEAPPTTDSETCNDIVRRLSWQM